MEISPSANQHAQTVDVLDSPSIASLFPPLASSLILILKKNEFGSIGVGSNSLRFQPGVLP